MSPAGTGPTTHRPPGTPDASLPSDEPRATSAADSLTALVRCRREYLSGDEKGEAQVFCDRLVPAPEVS